MTRTTGKTLNGKSASRSMLTPEHSQPSLHSSWSNANTAAVGAQVADVVDFADLLVILYAAGPSDKGGTLHPYRDFDLHNM